jgi:hypothetical protein
MSIVMFVCRIGCDGSVLILWNCSGELDRELTELSLVN